MNTSGEIKDLFFATGSQENFERIKEMEIPHGVYIVALTNETNEMWLLTDTMKQKLGGPIRYLVETHFPSITGVVLPECHIHRTDFVQFFKSAHP